jgi:hypothetical protein
MLLIFGRDVLPDGSCEGDMMCAPKWQLQNIAASNQKSFTMADRKTYAAI